MKSNIYARTIIVFMSPYFSNNAGLPTENKDACMDQDPGGRMRFEGSSQNTSEI